MKLTSTTKGKRTSYPGTSYSHPPPSSFPKQSKDKTNENSKHLTPPSQQAPRIYLLHLSPQARLHHVQIQHHIELTSSKPDSKKANMVFYKLPKKRQSTIIQAHTNSSSALPPNPPPPTHPNPSPIPSAFPAKSPPQSQPPQP